MNDAQSPIRIAITPGEPAGIGPDLLIQLAQQARSAEWVVYADPNLLQQRAEQLQLPLYLETVSFQQAPQPQAAAHLRVVPVAMAAKVACGEPQPANAAYVLNCLELATKDCLKQQCAALVTGPVHKAVINQAGIAFTGHTEFLAQLTQTPQVVMMLATEQLRVALVTTHIPLAQVSSAITPALLQETLLIIDRDLRRYFALKQPRIAVCGLNPHAGEGGYLGREEITVITPVLEKLRQQGLNLLGPLPADTAFTATQLAAVDVVVAMYHDQGLPVLKHQGFGSAVNITLGLPIIRTSVDHGTAFDLAGTGKADAGSLQAAIDTAITLAWNQPSTQANAAGLLHGH